MTSGEKIAAFRREVWAYYEKNGRHDLPWRKTTDPYKILVSEIMLQQTQVSRVVGKYDSFIKKFPTVRALAKAPLSEVLEEWSGLGYNRRGKYLHDASKIVVNEYGGNMKRALQYPLPGVGPYTRAAVRTFAFNEPHIFIETNIRTALIHHFFPHTLQVRDRAILVYAARAAEGQDPRAWHWALMDYGSHLKRSGVRNNHRSKHYARQSKFEGSLRQLRGEILRELYRGPTSAQRLSSLRMTGRGPTSAKIRVFPRVVLGKTLAGLERDGLIKKEKGRWQIA